MPYVYKITSDMDRVKWPQSFAVPQNWVKEGKQIALKKQTTNKPKTKKNPTYTLYIILKCTTK